MNIFEKLIYAYFRFFIYSYYRKKYRLNKEFTFNGYGIRIAGDGSLISGVRSYVSFFSYFNISEGYKIVIGDDVKVAHNVKIYTSSVDPDLFIDSVGGQNYHGDVIIGNNVLIGSNSFIMPNTIIGNNVIVGANTVVTKSLPDNVVFAGCPGKIIRFLNCNNTSNIKPSFTGDIGS